MFSSFTHLSQVKSFRQVKALLDYQFENNSNEVHTARWQGEDITKRPEMVTYELLNVGFTVPLNGIEHLSHWQFDVQPNLPWADNHFEERVCGAPINPGVEWANWPWGKNAEKFLDEGKFNHNYMQRYWPRFANYFFPATNTVKDWEALLNAHLSEKNGIGGRWGDLNDLVSLLAHEPDTRQAWLPIFFPEDTGDANPGRKPCTLGYQFIMRDNKLHVYYPLRSCDYIRHFSDDIYLTIRLLLWVLDRCRELNPAFWTSIEPGSYTMHCTSLHIFNNDFIKLQQGVANDPN